MHGEAMEMHLIDLASDVVILNPHSFHVVSITDECKNRLYELLTLFVHISDRTIFTEDVLTGREGEEFCVWKSDVVLGCAWLHMAFVCVHCVRPRKHRDRVSNPKG